MKKIINLIRDVVLTVAALSVLQFTQVLAEGNNNYSNTSMKSSNNINWEQQNNYWRKNFSSRSYYNRGLGYSTYEPAYQYGVNSFNQFNGMNFDDLDQSQLRAGWDNARGSSNLTWDQALPAFRDSYTRVYNSSSATRQNTNNNISPSAGSSPNNSNSNNSKTSSNY